MMYIRTKDGVYEIDEVKSYFLDEKQKLFINNELKIAINEQRVINQSENLEELCDEFVIPRYQDTFIVDRFSKQICLNHIKCGYGDVYGAIWTDKGLIYVAKMDENGELELI